eukprot:Platyproteum_vivax@DN2674_c0_g1_i1.p1
MGGCLGSFLGSFAASCACTIAFMGTAKTKRTGRFAYMFMMVFVTILSLLMRNWGVDLIRKYGVSYFTLKDCRNDLVCWQDQVIYRVCFSAVCILTMTFSATFLPQKLADRVHRSWFVLKYVSVPIITLAFLFTPNNVFEGFADACVYLSLISIVLQTIIFIHGAYCWNEEWIDRAQESQAWLAGILIAAAVMFCGALATSVWLLLCFPTLLPVVAVSVTAIAVLSLSILSVTDLAPHGAILTSSVVAAVSLFHTASAVFSLYDLRGSTVPWVRAGAGLIVAFVPLCFTCLSLQPVNIFHTDILPTNTDREEFLDTRESDTDGEDGTEVRVERRLRPLESDGFLRFFHLFLLSTMFYLTMILSNWGGYKPNPSGFWIQMCGTWMSLLLYCWTLLAPSLFPQRAFN